MRIFTLEMEDIFEAANLTDCDVLRTVVLPDKHFPHHCKKTHEATVQFLEDYQPHALISLGDWWEMGPVSHWQGNINFELLRTELEGGVDLLDEMVEACGDSLAYKSVLLGNHELWYKKLISKQAPGLRKFLKESGMDMHFSNVSGLGDKGYEVFGYNEALEIGENLHTHGVYINDAHAKKHVSVMGQNVLYGHTETQQLYSMVNARGVTQGISLGTQRDEKQCEFLINRPTNWVTGFGIVEYRIDGVSTIYAPKITDGVFSFGGKLYG